MNMHKNTCLTPHHRQAIWLAYPQEKESVTSLARRYPVSRVTIYRMLKATRDRLLKGRNTTDKRDDLFVAIDDFSRELYAAILPDKTADSAAKFLTEQVIEPCPYLIECVYSDNGSEYKGGTNHAFCVACWENDIN